MNGDYFSGSGVQATFGLNTVTVGPLGSSAMFRSSGQTAFNSAVKYLNGLTPPGGNIYVLGDANNYSGTNGSWYLTGTGIKVYWDKNARIKPPAITAAQDDWKSPVSPGGAASWYHIFVAANTTDCEIYGGPITDGSIMAHDLVSGFIEGGGNVRLKTYGQYCNTVSRFARWDITYSKILVKYNDGTSATIEVNAKDTLCQHYGPSSDGCGNSSVPDGGGRKWSPNGTSLGTVGAAMIQDCEEYGPIDRTHQFCGHDITSGQSPGHTMDGIKIIGGQSWGVSSGGLAGVISGSNGVFLEQGISGVTTNTKIIGHDVHFVATGFNLSLQNGVVLEGSNAFDCTSGLTTGPGTSGIFIGANHQYVAGGSYRCTTGIFLNMTPATGGSMIEGIQMKGWLVDDMGAQVTTTGLKVQSSSTKLIAHSLFEGVDVTRVASGGKPFDFSGTSGPALPECVFRNCPGITDTGKIATPYGSATQFDLRNNGINATPANASTNTYRQRMLGLVLISTTGGTGLSMTCKTPAGNPLAAMSATSGTSATPVASTDYVSDASQTLTISGGTGMSLTIVGPDGTTYARAQDTNVTTFGPTVLPAGTIINLGAFSAAPGTITSTLSATPFGPALTAVASFTTTCFPYNSTWQFVTNTTSPTITMTQNGNAISTPIFGYRECSLAGSAASATANIEYEMELCDIFYNASSAVALAVDDPRNNPTQMTSTTTYGQTLRTGYRVTSTTVGTQTAYAAG